jgi:hypothetical protein
MRPLQVLEKIVLRQPAEALRTMRILALAVLFASLAAFLELHGSHIAAGVCVSGLGGQVLRDLFK